MAHFDNNGRVPVWNFCPVSAASGWTKMIYRAPNLAFCGGIYRGPQTFRLDPIAVPPLISLFRMGLRGGLCAPRSPVREKFLELAVLLLTFFQPRFTGKTVPKLSRSIFLAESVSSCSKSFSFCTPENRDFRTAKFSPIRTFFLNLSFWRKNKEVTNSYR